MLPSYQNISLVLSFNLTAIKFVLCMCVGISAEKPTENSRIPLKHPPFTNGITLCNFSVNFKLKWMRTAHESLHDIRNRVAYTRRLKLHETDEINVDVS